MRQLVEPDAQMQFCRGRPVLIIVEGSGRCHCAAPSRLWIKAAVLFASAAFVFHLPCLRNIRARLPNPKRDAPDLRAVAVFEWTGDEAHPKAAGLSPCAFFDGQDLNDAGIYLRPPSRWLSKATWSISCSRMASPVGLFDIDTSAREQGGWVGYGKWRPLPKAKAAPAQVAKIDADDDSQSDVPILHRKHHADDSAAAVQSRVRERAPVPVRARRLPIPIGRRCTRAAMLQRRFGQFGSGRVRARALGPIQFERRSPAAPASIPDRPARRPPETVQLRQRRTAVTDLATTPAARS